MGAEISTLSAEIAVLTPLFSTAADRKFPGSSALSRSEILSYSLTPKDKLVQVGCGIRTAFPLFVQFWIARNASVYKFSEGSEEGVKASGEWLAATCANFSAGLASPGPSHPQTPSPATSLVHPRPPLLF